MNTSLQPPSAQYGLFAPDKTIDQRFADWKTLPGAGKVLQMFYREAAFYFRRFQERGVGCSVALIEEKVRDSIRLESLRAVPERGFALNCHFCSRIVRRMIEEHPEWRAMFELRETRS
ncbi:MAG: hypothetical protein ABFD89_06755 [Bryobacteraceae bacterium]